MQRGHTPSFALRAELNRTSRRLTRRRNGHFLADRSGTFGNAATMVNDHGCFGLCDLNDKIATPMKDLQFVPIEAFVRVEGRNYGAFEVSSHGDSGPRRAVHGVVSASSIVNIDLALAFK